MNLRMSGIRFEPSTVWFFVPESLVFRETSIDWFFPELKTDIFNVIFLLWFFWYKPKKLNLLQEVASTLLALGATPPYSIIALRAAPLLPHSTPAVACSSRRR